MAYLIKNGLLLLALGCLVSSALAALVLPGSSSEPLEPVTIHEGFIDAYISDNFETHHEEKIILLREPAGDVHHLVFEQTPSDLHTGAFVRVHGHKSDKRTIKIPMSERHVATKVSRFQVLHSHATETFQPQKKRSASSLELEQTDLRRVAVIITNFRDKSVSCSKDQIEGIMWGKNADTSGDGDFGNNKRSYEVNSFGDVSFARSTPVVPLADVFGPFTVPIDLEAEKTCRPEDWSWAAMEAARAAGVPLRDYRHLMFVLPQSDYVQSTLCKWNGLGNIGCGVQCKTWIGNCALLGVYVHELGHNYGLHHSALNPDLRGPVSEYGDPTAIMGNAWWSSDQVFYFTAPHRIQNGWMDPSRIAKLSSDGIYNLGPMNRLPHGADFQAITVGAPDMWQLNPQPIYILSYVSGEKVQFSNRVLLHIFYNSSSNSQLLRTFDRPGELWRDPTLSFSFRLLSLDAERARIEAKFGCALGPTQLSVRVASTDAIVPVPKGVVFESNTISPVSFVQRSGRRTGSNSVTLPSVDSVRLGSLHANATVFPVLLKQAARKFNISISLQNGDSPVCTPTFYSYRFSALPPGWTMSCKPDGKILLVGDQTCEVTCLIDLVHATNPLNSSFPVTFELNGENSTFASQQRSGTYNLLFVPSYECLRLPPTAAVLLPADLPASLRGTSTGDIRKSEILQANFTSSFGEPLTASVSMDIVSTSGLSVVLALRNADSSACSARSFEISLSSDSLAIWAPLGTINVSLTPQMMATVTLVVRLKQGLTLPSQTTQPLQFNIVETSAGVDRSLSLINATVVILPRCDSAAMLLSTTPDPGPGNSIQLKAFMFNFSMGGISKSVTLFETDATTFDIWARSSGSILVDITNGASSLCNATYYQVNVTTSSPAITASVVPARSTWPIGPGEHSKHKIAVTASDGTLEDTQKTHTVTVTIQDMKTGIKKSKVFQFDLVRPPCERGIPTLTVSCSSQITVDPSTPAQNIIIPNPADAWKRGLDSMRCNMFFRNTDLWTCPDRVMGLSWTSPQVPDPFIRNVTFQFNDVTLFATNYTFSSLVVWYNKSVSTISETSPVTSSFTVELTSRDVGASSPGAVARQVPVSITAGICSAVVPNITVAAEEFQNVTIFSGGVGIYWLRVQTFNNEYCGSRTYVVSLDSKQEEWYRSNKWDFSTPQSTRGGVVYGLVQPPPYTEGLFNFTWIVRDTANSSLTANVTTFIYVNGSCGIYEPLVTRLDPSTMDQVLQASALDALPFGQAQQHVILFNVTNRDSRNCSGSEFGLSVRLDTIPRIPGSISVSLGPNVTNPLYLSPGNSTIIPVIASMANSVFPNTYTATLEIRSGEITHYMDTPASWSITCPAPRPIGNLFVDESISALGVATGFQLKWDGCIREGDCCCPCTYDIFLRGKKIATTEYMNYTYTPTLSQAGYAMDFTIQTIDRHGRRSPAETCGTTVIQRVQLSNMSYLVVLLVLVGGILLVPSAVLLIEFLRTKGYIY